MRPGLPLLFAVALGAQTPPLPPSSVYSSPGIRETKSIAASTAAAPAAWRTQAEKSGWRETGSYDDTVAFYRRLEKASRYARLQSIGRTAEGRELHVLVVSKDRAFTPREAARTGKPVVLLQNGIHAGENGGKDAAMLLLRDVLVTRKHAAWLDRVILLSIPVFNADGHERTSPYNRINENGPDRMGFRVTAQRLNLNRDYLKADTPEMRAWLGLYTAWLPHLMIDNHVTDGGDSPYDLTIAIHSSIDIAPPVGRWVEESFVKPLLAGMEAEGHRMGWYAGFGGRQGVVAVQPFSPRYSTGYAAAQNRAALLIETHSLKSFRVRAWSHYDVMRHALDAVAASAAQLKKASAEADAWMAAPPAKVALDVRAGGTGEPWVVERLESERYAGSAAGGPVARYLPKLIEEKVQLVRTLEARLETEVPAGYVIPPAWSPIAELLVRHGVRSERLARAVEVEGEQIRFESVEFARQPFEGRFQTSAFKTVRERGRFPAPPGSFYIPLAQRAARVALNLLEPEAPDSAVRWGFFASIFETKEYFSDFVFEPIAQELLKQDQKLKAGFEAALAQDEALAKNPRARLAWLHRRSPYFEPGKDLYPVLRVARKTW